MTTFDDILNAREKRAEEIHDLSKDQTLVTIGVNYPGNDKNSYVSWLIFNSFSIAEIGFKYIDIKQLNSLDGPFYLLIVSDTPKHAKKLAMIFEENHPLGRMIDVDVYNQGEVITRGFFRKCYLCDQPAHVCVRSKNHRLDEVLHYIKEKVVAFYHQRLCTMIDDAVMKELNLEDKFGLVTPSSSGSHTDMDYQLMIKSKDVIMPYFLTMFNRIIEVNEITQQFDDLIEIGQQAENHMFRVTNGVNTYKGLIFHVSLVVISYGYLLSRNGEHSFFETIKLFGKMFFSRKKIDKLSFGDKALNQFQILGARGEALSGYRHVQGIIKKYHLNRDDLRKALIDLIISIEDTNLLKRARKMENYLKIKDLFREMDSNNIDQVKKMTQYCIEHHLTFGGSADLLILSILIDNMIKKHEKISLF